jgi:hypothetical protein
MGIERISGLVESLLLVLAMSMRFATKSYGLDAQAAESSPRGNSRYGIECVNPVRAVAGDTFDAMGMQRMPLHEAFYSASFIRGGWQMPPMQKYGVDVTRL